MNKIKQQIEKDQNDIIDMCAKIIEQNNIIVYPSSEAHSIHTNFTVKLMDKNNTPKESIFCVVGPSNGYGIKIISTGMYISNYDATPDMQDKIRKIYYACEDKSDKQKTIRDKIAEQENAKSWTETKQGLAKFLLAKSK
ncbi:MAG: hypothetical protein J5620_01910 [Alphaproteobacteria bacterium]|nr:hypothetical protein [Alphaproteobacteria bacterium]